MAVGLIVAFFILSYLLLRARTGASGSWLLWVPGATRIFLCLVVWAPESLFTKYSFEMMSMA